VANEDYLRKKGIAEQAPPANPAKVVGEQRRRRPRRPWTRSPRTITGFKAPKETNPDWFNRKLAVQAASADLDRKRSNLEHQRVLEERVRRKIYDLGPAFSRLNEITTKLDHATSSAEEGREALHASGHRPPSIDTQDAFQVFL
jgi:hypothetical protein